MYQPYDYSESTDESFDAKSHRLGRNSFSSQSPKAPSGWVFNSRKADVVFVVVTFIVSGLGIMWFISMLPFLLESAFEQYSWAKGMYATWGTPSMRWLFINVVVGVILATSGLLSAFGGDGGKDGEQVSRHADSRGYGSAQQRSYSANETRYAGTAYGSPLYNPYVERQEPRLHHESSFTDWNREAPDLARQREGEEEISEVRASGRNSNDNERDIASMGIPLQPEINLQQSREAPQPSEVSREVPRDVPSDTPMEVPVEVPTAVPMDVPVEVSRESPTDLSREVPIPEEILSSEDLPSPQETSMPRDISMSISREESQSVDEPISRDTPIPSEIQVSGAHFHKQISSPESTEGIVGNSGRGSGVSIISKTFDTSPELGETFVVHKDLRRVETSPVVRSGPLNETPLLDSPRKHEPVSKSHTFTIGRVIRRDQFADFIEPLSRKLEGITRKGPRLDAVRSFNSEPVPPVIPRRSQRYLSEPFGVSNPSIPKHTSGPVDIPLPPPTVKAVSPPSSPILRQRSIVYPPALLSQASIEYNTAPKSPPPSPPLSPPPSPPMGEAIPPPPPPHLKLPPVRHSKITSSEELPSTKFHLAPSTSQATTVAELASVRPFEKMSSSEYKKQNSHRRTNSARTIPSSSSSLVISKPPPSPSSSAHAERSLTVKSQTSSAIDQEVIDGPALNRQDGSLPKDDDLHQQIEDFLARFHENWRLQRQESLARYKKRLVELDEGQ